MKTIRIISCMLFLLMGVAITTGAVTDPAKNKKKETVTFHVNMSCGNCKAKIEKNIAWEKGVKDLKVNLEEKTVTLVYDPCKNTEPNLKKAIEKLGYSCDVPQKEK